MFIMKLGLVWALAIGSMALINQNKEDKKAKIVISVAAVFFMVMVMVW